jgi:hypothetical protein
MRALIECVMSAHWALSGDYFQEQRRIGYAQPNFKQWVSNLEIRYVRVIKNGLKYAFTSSRAMLTYLYNDIFKYVAELFHLRKVGSYIDQVCDSN